MRLQKKAGGVIFADGKLERAFESLSEEDWLKKVLRKAIDDLKENVFAGENILKKLIPKDPMDEPLDDYYMANILERYQDTQEETEVTLKVEVPQFCSGTFTGSIYVWGEAI